MKRRAILRMLVSGTVLAGAAGCAQIPEQTGTGDAAFRTIESGTFQSFVRNWDNAAEPVLYALIRNPAEWDCVFHPAPVMGGNRPFAPEASFYEKEQILVVAKVSRPSATLILDEVVADGGGIVVRYSFADEDSDKSYTVKKHLNVVLPRHGYKRIVLEENETKIGSLNLIEGQWSVPEIMTGED